MVGVSLGQPAWCRTSLVLTKHPLNACLPHGGEPVRKEAGPLTLYPGPSCSPPQGLSPSDVLSEHCTALFSISKALFTLKELKEF